MPWKRFWQTLILASILTLALFSQEVINGYRILVAVTAPATPASGRGSLYVDSTSKNLSLKDDNGTVKHGIQTATCTNQFASAVSDAGAVTCTTVTLAGAQFANQGTTTTLLHGNAAGNPSFAAVSLTADVSGTLPGGNGGTNNAFFQVSGPATSLKTFTFPNASATIPQTIATGTSALGTGAISGNSCATVVTTSATGALTTDVISYTPNADISGVTGYGVASTDGLIIYPYPTADNVNFRICNSTGTSITPGAVTLNWRVSR